MERSKVAQLRGARPKSDYARRLILLRAMFARENQAGDATAGLFAWRGTASKRA